MKTTAALVVECALFCVMCSFLFCVEGRPFAGVPCYYCPRRAMRTFISMRARAHTFVRWLGGNTYVVDDFLHVGFPVLEGVFALSATKKGFANRPTGCKTTHSRILL